MLDSESRTYGVLKQIGVDYVRFAKININDRNWKRKSKLTGKIRKGKIDSSGRLRKSLKYDIEDVAGSLELFIEGTDYAQDINDGAKRKTSQSDIMRWIKQKNLRLTSKTGFVKMTPALVESFTNFVAWKVSTIGSDYTGYLDAAYKKATDKHGQELERAIAADGVEAIIETLDQLNGIQIDLRF